MASPRTFGAPRETRGAPLITHAISPLFDAISRTTALILLTAVVIRPAASLVALLGARISSRWALAMLTARGVVMRSPRDPPSPFRSANRAALTLPPALPASPR